jgi:hypothetical protein
LRNVAEACIRRENQQFETHRQGESIPSLQVVTGIRASVGRDTYENQTDYQPMKAPQHALVIVVAAARFRSLRRLSYLDAHRTIDNTAHTIYSRSC